MNIRYMDSLSHDKHIAYVSHLSHISSFMLGKTVMDKEKNENNIFDMAGSGFESTVRLAKSSPEMWAPIFKLNKDNIIESLNQNIINLKPFGYNYDFYSTMTCFSENNNVTYFNDFNQCDPPILFIDKFNLNRIILYPNPVINKSILQLPIEHSLKNTKATVFRAGIWKPRTRPGNFEGVGALGLKWLQKAKQETGMLISTEVANANHVDLALNHDIDILWVGARSTVSPFIVQEIAEALKGTDKTVLIKNPVNPDLALWLGGIERFYSCNVKNLGVIHRGFSTYEKTNYRNNPEWQIAIELQNKFPDLPLILDPSHMGGRRDMIFDLCQTALDLNYDGFMVETHHDPDNAWSDAAQQVTPKRLIQIMKDLKIY